MTGPVLGLAEVVIWVRDMDRALGFYAGVFGLPVISPPSLPNRFLQAGEGRAGVPQMVVLVPHPDPGGTFPPSKPERTLHHLALNVAGDRYEELARACAEAGLEVRSGVHPVLAGVRTFYVNDPDGNEVEVIAAGDPTLAGAAGREG